MARHRSVLARTLVSLVLVLVLPGCSTWKPLRQPLDTTVTAPDPTRHVLVILREGGRLELEIDAVTADSLHGRTYAPDPAQPRFPPSLENGRPVVIARSDIARIESRRFDPAVTSLCVVAIAGLFVFVYANSGMNLSTQ